MIVSRKHDGHQIGHITNDNFYYYTKIFRIQFSLTSIAVTAILVNDPEKWHPSRKAIITNHQKCNDIAITFYVNYKV